MRIKRKWINRRILLFISFILIISGFLFHRSRTQSSKPYIPSVRIRPNKTIPFKKVSVAHYTTTFGTRTDSTSKPFNSNLNQICELLDLEEYIYADGVIVSLVDFVRFPTLPNKNESYRKKYQSQLWVFNTEESPRNAYRTVEMNNITDLDNWFNLTATLKPESDLHIQYKGYRIKPEIIELAQNKLKLTFNRTSNLTYFPTIDVFKDQSSIYFNTLAAILNKELQDQQNYYSNNCPYTCNKRLPSHLIKSLQPYLKPIVLNVQNRDIVYIAWFVSNCDSNSGREEYVSKLRSQPGIHVDIYGSCSSIFNSHIVSTKCPKGPTDCKEKILLNYRFYLAFENSKCDTYITEKYWMQGLNGHAVPIVLGAKREQYKRIAVPNSYIHVDDYSTVEELAQELHRLNKNDSEFIKYLQWTQLYDIGSEYSPTATYDFYNILCLLGHYIRIHGMNGNTIERSYLLKTIRDIFNVRDIRLPNFNWDTASTKSIKISKFYNPKVNCWDNGYPSLPRRIYNFLFTWWK